MSGDKTYVDTPGFIDLVRTKLGASIKTDRQKDVWHLQKLLEANRDGAIEVFTSTLTIAECQYAGDEPLDDAVKAHLDLLLLSGQYVRLVQLTPFIAKDARDLRWSHGVNLRGADSVHVASAIAMGCVEILSADKRFERIEKHKGALSKLGIAPRACRNTAILPDKYRQESLPYGDGKKKH